jgi:hypothetical protein
VFNDSNQNWSATPVLIITMWTLRLDLIALGYISRRNSAIRSPTDRTLQSDLAALSTH